MRILVTGASGFVGSHLARELVRRGHDVIGADNLMKFEGRDYHHHPDDFELVNVDLCKDDLEARLGSGWDRAYHLAAIVGVAQVCANPRAIIRNNALSTIRFLDWAQDRVEGRILFASSCENYAAFHGTDLLPIPTPEDVYLGIHDIYNPRWTYAATKILGELGFVHSGHDYVIVRFHNIYGPAMYSRHVIPELFSKIWQGVDPLQVVSASHTRVFCHVRDAVAGTIAAMEAELDGGHVVNIGSPAEEITIGDLARQMVEISGRDIRVDAAEDVPGSVQRRRPDVTLMDTLLGGHRFTTLEEGLEECWAWQEKSGWIA